MARPTRSLRNLSSPLLLSFPSQTNTYIFTTVKVSPELRPLVAYKSAVVALIIVFLIKITFFPDCILII